MVTAPKRPIRILFDAHALIGSRTGVGYYTSQLIAHLAAQYPQEVECIGYYHNFLLRKSPVSDPSAPNIRYVPIAWFPGQIVNLLRRWHINVPIELLTFTRADFILYPNYLGMPSFFKTPNAPVIHDLTFVDHPETMSDKNRDDLQRFAPSMMQRASFVITVSEFSRKRIIETFGLQPQRVHVTHNPPPQPVVLPEAKSKALVAQQGIDKPFLLYVGTIEPRKNLAALMNAYVALPAKVRQSYSLVLAGKIDWKFAETKQKISDLQDAGYDIKYLGYIDDSTRSALYLQAALFVFPPFYEGFGMPILEALSYGTACAVSDIKVFHEVGGKAVAYFDPNNPQAMAAVISSELQRPSTTQKQRKDQASSFSWDTLCSQLYQKIQKSL